MKIFDLNRLANRKIVVHCRTNEEAKDFCQKMHNLRKRWRTGDPYRKDITYWGVFKENTCYDFNSGTYCSTEYYKVHNYDIIEWSDYMNNFKKSDLTNGDIVVRRNGNIEIACVDTDVLITENGKTFPLEYIKEDLTSSYSENFDIVEVYRPEEPLQCSFLREEFQEGNLVYYREPDPIEITLEEIAELKGVSVDKIKIVF